jgi:hypothetical protein
VTKTVDGMCADCWGVKDAARAARWQSGPRSGLRMRSGWDPVGLLWALGTVVFLVLVALYAVTRWI